MNKQKTKFGLPPGSLIYTGEGTEESHIEQIIFGPDTFLQSNLHHWNDLDSQRNEICWINFCGINDIEKIQLLGEKFNISPLILEDILNTNQRPKIDFFKHYVFVTLTMLTYDKKEEKIIKEHLSFILMKNILISLQEYKGDIFDAVRDRIRKNKGTIRRRGADYLLYALLDEIVDYYLMIMSDLETKINQIEDQFLNADDTNMEEALHLLRRNLLVLRTSTWPLKDLIDEYSLKKSELITSDNENNLKDLKDHIYRVIDEINYNREILEGLDNSYQSRVSNRMNKVMTTLTIFSSIFIPLTFLAGIYGMNFEHMPELKMKYGYPSFLIISIIISVIMIAWFKKRKLL